MAILVTLAVFQFRGAVPTTCLLIDVIVPSVISDPKAVVRIKVVLLVILCMLLEYTIAVVCIINTSPIDKDELNVAPGQVSVFVALIYEEVEGVTFGIDVRPVSPLLKRVVVDKEIVPTNIEDILVTLDVFQDPMFLLKFVAPENIEDKIQEETPEVSTREVRG